jgi:glycogen operon protein
MTNSPIQRGHAFPIGATASDGGVNFSVFSKRGTSVSLLLFDRADDPRPARVIPLDRRLNRTHYYWHVFVPGIGPGQIYAFTAGGPFAPECGLRFDPDKLLMDPYGRAVARPAGYDRLAASRSGNNCAMALKSVVTDPGSYDWEGVEPPHHPFSRTVIYEMHVAGFTKNPNSGLDPSLRGTYRGLIEKIPYLKQLGVTAVELLPVFQFDEQDAPQGLTNYWGYAPVSFFAPHAGYSAVGDPLGALDEFRDMVKALHRAGIEVILDVVYNHTAEGDEHGPTLCFKGLANDTYYILERDRARYSNYTGTGNTLNANQPYVRRMIMDSLRYWVQEMHVDGFRFDLASILSRDESGLPMDNPTILWEIESDPVLAETKLIAEAWDAAGLYQVGRFAGDRWKEWNGKFRDDMRGFLRAEEGTVARLPKRLLASPDLFGHEEREPEQSVNFVSCHDGFTLNDLVSYELKRNGANGEENRDGANDNRSWNCGVEGPTDDPAIERLRNRQVKNFHTLTLLSMGVPMLSMGDEVRRTQCGNNNAYCQDNELSWFDWSLVKTHGDILRFVSRLVDLRVHRVIPVENEEKTLNELLGQARLDFHGVELHKPDWSDQSHCLAVTVLGMHGEHAIHLMMNAYWEPLEFELPDLTGHRWYRWINTALESPEDISDWLNAPVVGGKSYRVESRSVAALIARK